MSVLERLRYADYLPKRDQYAASKRTANQFAQEHIATVAEQMLQTGVLAEHQEPWMRNLGIPSLTEIDKVQVGTIPILHLGDRGYNKNPLVSPDTILIWQPTFNGLPLSPDLVRGMDIFQRAGLTNVIPKLDSH